ncbi:MAG: polysaccharide lyase [Hyphomicrobiaceae bacterium]
MQDLKARLGQKAWGLDENVTIGPDGPDGPDGETVLTVRLPRGSINPKNKTAPLGGMGWRWRPPLPDRLDRACLTYRLYLDRDFGFRRGGKLPGLFGGDAPAGGRATDGRTGFSARLMWRHGGAGEVYAYIPGHPENRGASLGRGAWWFDRARWIEITQEIVLNAPDKADGSIRIWIDGVLRLERHGLVLRTSASVGIDGVMADVFFGGKTASWAAPHDTMLRLSAFDLRWPSIE